MRKPKAKLKLKTKRAAVKRFKLTATGKIKRHKRSSATSSPRRDPAAGAPFARALWCRTPTSRR
jgi:hypothetical protein